MELTYEQAIQLVKDYKKETGKTQSAIAAELGISDGGLSSFLSGGYKTPHCIIPKVEGLFKVKEQRKIMPKDPDFVETSVTRRVTEIITYCHMRGKNAVIYGDAGVGKTQAIRAYLRDNSLAIGFTAAPCYASITGVNELIASRLGIRERGVRKIYEETVSRLSGSGRVLIIDEAQHLNTLALEHLRSIADASGIGIAFVGNKKIYTRMRGSGEAEFAQLFSRNGMRLEVLTSDITRDDICRVFAEARLDDASLDLLYKIAHTKYGLRGAVNVFVNTAAVFGTCDAPSIARMGREMNIG